MLVAVVLFLTRFYNLRKAVHAVIPYTETPCGEGCLPCTACFQRSAGLRGAIYFHFFKMTLGLVSPLLLCSFMPFIGKLIFTG